MISPNVAADARAWRLAVALAAFGRVLLALPLVGVTAWLLAVTAAVTAAVVVVAVYVVVGLVMLVRFWSAAFRYTIDRRDQLITRRSFSEQLDVLRCAGTLLLRPRRSAGS